MISTKENNLVPNFVNQYLKMKQIRYKDSLISGHWLVRFGGASFAQIVRIAEYFIDIFCL